MSQRMNEFSQPIGEAVHDWSGVEAPSRQPMEGQFCRLEAMDATRHAKELFQAYTSGDHSGLWTYMGGGPFGTSSELKKWMEPMCESTDPLFHAIIDKSTDKAVGMAAYLRIVPLHGVIEVGHIAFSPLLQKTPIATECMYLMMKRVFNELGYRRYEWKCDALNAASRRAAIRFGFTYDGLFEQALIYKGRNRDTAWYSILDRDWPPVQRAFETWLDPSNFDNDGRQKHKLFNLIKEQRAAS